MREQVWWARRVGELLSGVLVWCDITNNQIGCNETGFIEVKPLISFCTIGWNEFCIYIHILNWLNKIFFFILYSQLVWLLWTKIKETLSLSMNVAEMKIFFRNEFNPLHPLILYEEVSFVDSDSTCSRNVFIKGLS